MAYDTITYSGIRNQLIEYFSEQEQFKSYDFTAPGISTLIDALAYSIHYMTVYSNFALNESFLDTAINRSSVVSKAKALGYMPYQYTSAIAQIRIDYTGTTNLDNMIILKGSKFTSIIDNVEYIFSTTENAIVQKNEIGRYFALLNIKEGIQITQKWTKEYNDTRYILTHPRLDLNDLKVRVYESESDTIGIEYKKLESANQLVPVEGQWAKTNRTCVYTIIENTDGNIELIFGDGVLSQEIKTGNIVECTYFTSSGSAVNNASAFYIKDIVSDPTGYEGYIQYQWKVTTIESAAHGADREEIESIKLIAPKFFQRQYRDVTAEDYKTAILAKYGGLIDSINVWGGENNIPPKYGTVCACIKPTYGNKISPEKKKEITNFIYESSVVGLTFEIIDPDILFVDSVINIYYDMSNSSNTINALKKQTKEIIEQYFLELSTSFLSNFIYSKLLAKLFAMDKTIYDTVITLTLSKYIVPIQNIKSTYTVKFDNEIVPGSIYSDTFLQLDISYKDAIIKDDEKGKLFIHIDNTRKEIGSVDYKTGELKLIYNFNIYSLNKFKFYCRPEKLNVSTSNNTVFSYNNTTVIINDGE